MTDTTRYSPSEFMGAIMLQTRDGEYVRFDDYAALLTRAEAAEAERDALQAKLALAVEALSFTVRADNLRDFYHSLPNDKNRIGDKRSKKGHARDAWLRAFRKAAKNARATLAQLTADTSPDPRIEGWNAAIEAAARKVEIHNLGRNKDRADRMLASIRTIPCPYTPKEGKDDE